MTPALLQHHLKPEEKVLQPEKHEEHAVYISIFDSYPLLRSRPLLQIDSSIISLNPQTSPSLASSSNPNHTNISSPSHNVSYTPSSSFFMSRHLSPSLLPDLRPLRLATASQFLGSSKRLCQYEIPGGGRCADAGCEDIHISRMGGSASMDANVEPGDQDTADYLSTAVPDSWVTAYGSSLTSRLVAALEDTRLNHPTITLEERVARVCDMLQPHPPTT
ncbi:hypothetical protein BT96DRAFT_261345 [Gymnopus androsaceus JB14]|uniref:Zinc-finger domain-containing protein n=1 Tax=Gymnopus androsaceus JB14 TaxID=1447944 RepID=A0A6A4H3R1_9AGAR|nr:hypothetical protein BT96DRAFT_261345 [Gymnopus androsaceus JB14]